MNKSEKKHDENNRHF